MRFLRAARKRRSYSVGNCRREATFTHALHAPAAQWSAFTTLDSRPPASGGDFMGVEHRPEVFSGSGAQKPAHAVGSENNKRILGNLSSIPNDFILSTLLQK